jgi:hypothetical protein
MDWLSKNNLRPRLYESSTNNNCRTTILTYGLLLRSMPEFSCFSVFTAQAMRGVL